MKKQALGIIAMIIVICQFNLGTLFAQKVRELPFKREENPVKLESRRTMDASPLSLKIAMATAQPVSGQGLKFTLVITNNSSTEISLYNPLIALTPWLINEKGEYISFSNIRMSMDVNYVTFYVPNFEAFEIGDTFINGKKHEVDYHTSETINIPANGTYQVNLSVLNVRVGPGATSDHMGSAINKLKKGRYKLSFRASISTARTEKAFFVYSLNTPEIEVDYGQ